MDSNKEVRDSYNGKRKISPENSDEDQDDHFRSCADAIRESSPTIASTGSSGNVRRVVRSRTPSACVRCKAAKAKCSEQRPCPRCLRSGDAVACAAELGPVSMRPGALQQLAGSLVAHGSLGFPPFGPALWGPAFP
eukprot:CAMPEP_0113674824 /NCGR_PEP_ID=MMETSP0038_2-20120614/7659_1 /TAXON_ID=2898 /ORGANISM="Cryptomonas paramecium" /LENGTH=135 /DNA_ID=CAMNT_0000591499 /DNA_START=369 /DNA_END=773 /DNA_ORIENTATION=- /assembly_acc=CAM_ASM_000170